MMASSPELTTSMACLAMSSHCTYHCGLMIGSTMSLLLEHMGTTIGLSLVSL